MIKICLDGYFLIKKKKKTRVKKKYKFLVGVDSGCGALRN
jgi:hypothetical protein